jgi:hypothetical protein
VQERREVELIDDIVTLAGGRHEGILRSAGVPAGRIDVKACETADRWLTNHDAGERRARLSK